jgi:signal transduction histidine kinase
MEKLLKFVNSSVFVICFFGIFFLLLLRDQINPMYDLASWVIPALCFIFIFYFSYRFVILYFSTDKIEYEFTSIVNHTFRTPLTRINWISKELEKRDISQDEKLLYIQNLNNATTKLLEIVDLIAGIKDIKNTTGYVFVATSIRDVVEKSMVKYREDINKKNTTFKVSTFKDIPFLTLDLKKISFVIDALIENAITYTPHDGKVLIDCMVQNNNKLLFYITDSGLGLSSYDKFRIFSRFYRSKKAVLAYPDGMGLKLYLSKQIIKLHGGKIYAKSEGRDKGSAFFIELPLSR